MALNIVIIGGGAGGLELATTLGRKHAKDAGTHITPGRPCAFTSVEAITARSRGRDLEF